MCELPPLFREVLPSLREYWLLLDSYDWESYRRFLEEGDVLSRQWHEKYAATYQRIIDVAEVSDEHAALAASFESALLNLEPRPPQPV
jgi:hypothetical protein